MCTRECKCSGCFLLACVSEPVTLILLVFLVLCMEKKRPQCQTMLAMNLGSRENIEAIWLFFFLSQILRKSPHSYTTPFNPNEFATEYEKQCQLFSFHLSYIKNNWSTIPHPHEPSIPLETRPSYWVTGLWLIWGITQGLKYFSQFLKENF